MTWLKLISILFLISITMAKPDSPNDTLADADISRSRQKRVACFLGDEILVTDEGDVKIRDLVSRKDVHVLSRNDEGQLEFSPVYSWLHVNASQEAEFVVLTTESGHSLSVTNYHLIYETDCRGDSKTVFATKVNVGSCVFVNRNGEIKESKVIEKYRETKVGIYAPITTNGNIVVNGVLASCFTNHENEVFQKLIYSFLHSTSRIVAKFIPAAIIEFFWSSPLNAVIDVPQAFLSFLDLEKIFMK